MLKNFHVFFCSMVSFMAYYMFMLEDTGVISKTLVIDNYVMFLTFMTFMCLISISWLTSSSIESKWLLLVNISMLLIFIYIYIIHNFFLFYMIFEISVIPMMFYISSWGYSLDRVKAMMYMFMYTFFFSLPFILSIFFYSKKISMNIISSSLSFFSMNELMILLCLLMFLVKIPVWGFHLWLPKAHVEASTEGSMILAGVVLKLAGIGLIKYSNLTCSSQNNFMNYIICSMSIIGAIAMGVYCIRHSDAKVIIALSSIVHMSFLYLSYSISTSMSFLAMNTVMVAHGVISPLMFLFLGVVYNNISSRALQHLKGLLKNFLYLSLLWFILCMFNMGLPLSMNFFGEMLFFFSSNSFSMKMTLVISILIFINGFFNSYLLTFLSGGKEKDYDYNAMHTNILCMMYAYLVFVILMMPNVMEM